MKIVFLAIVCINCSMYYHFLLFAGEFQPQFAGYDQQDSQELMGFLLDGLHVSGLMRVLCV